MIDDALEYSETDLYAATVNVDMGAIQADKTKVSLHGVIKEVILFGEHDSESDKSCARISQLINIVMLCADEQFRRRKYSTGDT